MPQFSSITRNARLLPLSMAVVMCAFASGVQADDVWLFELRSGGRVQGEWLNRDEKPLSRYVIKADHGGVLALARNQVVRKDMVSSRLQQYEQLRVATADTVEEQMKLAAWCRDKNLPKQRESHLQRVVALEPEHAEARRLLGYRLVGRRWMTREGEMAARGMIYYQNQYRTAQDITIMERNKRRDDLKLKWIGEVRRLRGWLNGSRHDQAVASFRAIRDPWAVPALQAAIANEPSFQIKMLMIDTLAAIGTPTARAVLVDLSLKDERDDIRMNCLDHVVAGDSRVVLEKYVHSLASKDNQIVNRAGYALGEIGNPEVIPNLIDALVTNHKFKLVAGNEGQTNASFSPSGGGGFQFGGEGPKIVKQDIANRDVLASLIKLAKGANYQFDKQQWKSWYILQKRSDTVNTRRD